MKYYRLLTDNKMKPWQQNKIYPENYAAIDRTIRCMIDNGSDSKSWEYADTNKNTTEE